MTGLPTTPEAFAAWIWPASPVGARHDTPRQAGARAGALTSWTTRGRGRSPR